MVTISPPLPPAAYLPDSETLVEADESCLATIVCGATSASTSDAQATWLVLVAAGPTRTCEILSAVDSVAEASPVQRSLLARIAELEAELAALRSKPPSLPSAGELAQIIRIAREELDAADIAAVLRS